VQGKGLNKHRKLLVVVCGALTMTTAAAAEYPNRPIRYIVPSAAGGGPDTSARLLVAELSRQMGQQIVVDNRPGATGSMGTELIVRAAPDGYTIGHGNTPTLAINRSVLPNVPYDPDRDLQKITQTIVLPNLLGVTPSLPVKSVKELIDYAKNNPGKLSFASSGNGSTIHLSAELFKLMTGTQMIHIPYKAAQQAITDMIGGQVHLMFDNLSSILPHVKAGRVRALGVTGPKLSRHPRVADDRRGGCPRFRGYRLGWSCGPGRRAESHSREAQRRDQQGARSAGVEGKAHGLGIYRGGRYTGAIRRIRQEGNRKMGRRRQALGREG
jgi:tripartite-type tricarboxylate transporter receptor subunit TctC